MSDQLDLLTYPNADKRKRTPLHDQMMSQLATITKEDFLLVLQSCAPPVIPPAPPGMRNTIEMIDIKMGIPIRYNRGSADAVIDVVVNSKRLKILVEIKTEIQSASEVLDQINKYHEQLGTDKRVLICPKIEEYEQSLFASQGISVFRNFDKQWNSPDDYRNRYQVFDQMWKTVVFSLDFLTKEEQLGFYEMSCIAEFHGEGNTGALTGWVMLLFFDEYWFDRFSEFRDAVFDKLSERYKDIAKTLSPDTQTNIYIQDLLMSHEDGHQSNPKTTAIRKAQNRSRPTS